MSKFKASFRFYEKAAPFPGQCVFSGETTNLWEVGSLVVQGQAVPVLLSDRVLVELATSTGFVTKAIHEKALSEKDEIISKQAAQLDEAPKLLKGLSDDINRTLSDFVTNLAGVASNNVSNGNKGTKASGGSSKAKSGPAVEAGQGESESTEPSTELVGE